MQKELQIVFRGIDQSDALKETVRKKVSKLERVCDNIIGCRVVLDSPHNHHHKGKQYSVSINASTPDGDIVVNGNETDIYVAIRDAFAATYRQLDSVGDKRRASYRTAAN